MGTDQGPALLHDGTTSAPQEPTFHDQHGRMHLLSEGLDQQDQILAIIGGLYPDLKITPFQAQFRIGTVEGMDPGEYCLCRRLSIRSLEASDQSFF